MEAKDLKRSVILNTLILACVIAGVVITFAINAPKGALTSYGFANFRFFTVLSNVFCGICALLTLLHLKKHSDITKGFVLLKLMAAAGVGLTFLTIAAFLGPIYGLLSMYRGANLFFHLIVPIIAVIDFILLDTRNIGGIPFSYTIFSVIPVILYGLCYTANLLINGIGEWPNTNDWYGFVNWGYPIGFCIFACLIVVTWLIACILRALALRTFKRK